MTFLHRRKETVEQVYWHGLALNSYANEIVLSQEHTSFLHWFSLLLSWGLTVKTCLSHNVRLQVQYHCYFVLYHDYCRWIKMLLWEAQWSISPSSKPYRIKMTRNKTIKAAFTFARGDRMAGKAVVVPQRQQHSH